MGNLDKAGPYLSLHVVETTREQAEAERGLLKGPGGVPTSHRATGEARMSQTWVRHQGHDAHWPFLLPQLTSLGISAASFPHVTVPRPLHGAANDPRESASADRAPSLNPSGQVPLPPEARGDKELPRDCGALAAGKPCRSAPRLPCAVLVHSAPGMAFGPLGQCLSLGNHFLCRAGQVPGLAMKSDVDCIRLTQSWFARERCCCTGSPRLIPGPPAAVTIHTPSTSHSHTLFKLRRTQPTTQRREMRGGRQGGRRALMTLTGTDGHCRRDSVLPVADQRAGGHRPAALGGQALETLTLLHETC